MNIAFHFIVLIVSGVLVIKAGGWFVKGAVDVGAALRLSKVFIGVTIVSLVTTTPELVVSSVASYIGETGLALGNAVGSCLCNIGLVFPMAILIEQVPVHAYDLRRIGLLAASLLAVFIFALNGILSGFEGAILLVLLIAFLAYSYRAAVRERALAQEVELPRPDNRLAVRGLGLLLAGGAATVLIARYGLIHSGLAIAHYFRLPPAVIGLTMLAVGTSLPELVTAVVASRKGHGELALGNAVGASILNLLWVLGVSGIIRPLRVDRQTLVFNLPAAFAIIAAMFFLARSRSSFSRREGISLVTGYAAYITILLTVVY